MDRRKDGPKQAVISKQTWCRWRKEYGGLKLDRAERLKVLEQENAKLRPLVTEPSLEKQILEGLTRL